MGRQAHLARLALGRSPFGPPLRDDDEKVIVGSHTYDNDAKGYVQQFSATGHPTNESTDLADRQLSRAQNEVYRLAGVVQAKRDVKPKSPWQALSASEKVDVIEQENSFATNRRSIPEEIILHSCTWWLTAIRNRLLTYQSYSAVQFTEVIDTEFRSNGFLSLVGSGLPPFLTSSIIAQVRSQLFNNTVDRLDLREPRSKHRSEGSILVDMAKHLLDFGTFCLLQWPLRAFSILKSLRLISNAADSSVTAVIPWYQQSVGWFPPLPERLTGGTAINYACTCFLAPVFLAYTADLLIESIRTGFMATIRTLVPKPDEPDNPSKLACAGEGIFAMSLPGLGQKIHARRRYYGPRTALGCLEMAFPTTYGVLHRFFGLPLESKTRLSLVNHKVLFAACEDRYNRYLHNNLNRPPSRRVADSAIRHATVQEVLEEHHIDFRAETICINDWAEDLTALVIPSPSTATPAPSDLFAATDWHTESQGFSSMWEGLQRVETSNLEHRPSLPSPPWGSPQRSTNSPAAGVDHINGFVTGDQERVEDDSNDLDVQTTAVHGTQDGVLVDSSHMMLDRLLEPVDLQEPPRPVEPPSTPLPGIERAPPLTRTSLRPIRRPTEVDDGLDAITDRVNTADYLKRCLEEPEEPVHHRVTLLSNWPVDMLASYGSSLLTSALMLPLDLMVNRLLVRSFLAKEIEAGGLSTVTLPLLRDLWPLNSMRFPGIGTRDSLRLTGSMFATFALQGLLSSIVWDVRTRMIMHVGKRYYGWGKF